jgi:hypothetical protein
VRLILENSTVCLISRRISLFCPVGIHSGPALVGLVVGVSGFFDDDSDNMSVSFFVMDVALIDCPAGLLLWWWVGGYVFDGEFDPGSGRTLAACLTHASRAERPLRWYSSGERVSNT